MLKNLIAILLLPVAIIVYALAAGALILQWAYIFLYFAVMPNAAMRSDIPEWPTDYLK